MTADGEEEDNPTVLPFLEGQADDFERATGLGGVDIRTYMAVARHLSKGGWVILAEPWLITRPGQHGGVELHPVAVLQGGRE
jgi:hypothetical protein